MMLAGCSSSDIKGIWQVENADVKRFFASNAAVENVSLKNSTLELDITDTNITEDYEFTTTESEDSGSIEITYEAEIVYSYVREGDLVKLKHQSDSLDIKDITMDEASESDLADSGNTKEDIKKALIEIMNENCEALKEDGSFVIKGLDRSTLTTEGPSGRTEFERERKWIFF